ncbi:MAG: sugar nucleotide-binding protein [Candidatus Omnitrophica bacterium]|nr:sugar nucleotide-binding protein [Candidatus Omnitrophota bacterium]
MDKKFKRVLITGATGQLGSRLVSSGLFPGPLTPSRRQLDLCEDESVREYFQAHSFDAVIHTAALARMRDCHRNPALALETNMTGTLRLVRATLDKEKKIKKTLRFVYISTDGVYAGVRGRYKETDAAIPYNHYGWTKLGGECAVHLLRDHCIVRTRYFDPGDLPFTKYTADAYNSGIPLDELVKAIYGLLYSEFSGTVNVGGRRGSDYGRYRKYKTAVKPCLLKEIQKKTPFILSRDASLNCGLWRKINPYGAYRYRSFPS